MDYKTQEKKFETEIEEYLLEHDWIKGNPKNYNKEHALDTTQLFSFIKNSQPKEWDKIIQKYGSNAETEFIKRLKKVLASQGTLKILREGFRDAPAKFNMMYTKPSSTMNQTTIANYNQNILSVTRQVYYSTENNNSLDMVLFINGIPFATLELKTGKDQKVQDACKQYRNNRNHRELLFKCNERTLIHFALDPDEIQMTTKLEGHKTIFLPFNKGDNFGKGNPLNPHGSRTSYLWEELLQKDSIIDILHRFIHKDKYGNIIFPRYHQLDIVRKLISDVKQRGSGENYLIQHSAGSGKSNSIAWLAHHLQNLHNNNNEVIFNSVIVITDRRVLDDQLQKTIYQFDHVEGVVTNIDTNSKQLEEAIQTGKKIIITTLQKFSFIDMFDTISKVKGKQFALIIDEAHSSQAGKSSTTLRNTLGNPEQEEELEKELNKIAKEELEEELNNDAETQINNEISKQGKPPNLSFFAFTATPKPRTLEIFGTKGEDGLPQPFHTYSMKQAIEEGFILDVLKNYQTYNTYFKLVKKIVDDPKYNTRLANKSLAKYLNLHSYNLSQKTEIMIEHFKTVTKNKIGGQAKAMLVTSSRAHALRYYQTFKEYIKKNAYENEIKILIAFSGKLIEDGIELTEEKLNQFKETELKQKFHDDYNILIVAEKYQTGFDQPLLHTMFVDKPLGGVKAVQTLSRINRIHALKEDTFILDFVNTTEEIRESFEPYYKSTEIDEITDDNLVYDIKIELDNYRVYWETEINNFAQIFFDPKNIKSEFNKIQAYINPAIDRYKGKPEEEQENFKSLLTKFIRAYALITNLISLGDPELHKFYAYAKILLTKLRPSTQSSSLNLDDEVELEYYRLQQTFAGSIKLEGDDVLSNSKHAGKKSAEDEPKDFLSEIIQHLNELFGTTFTGEDKLFVEQLYLHLEKNEQIQMQARNNTSEHLELALKNNVIDSLIASYSNNKKLVDTFLENDNMLIALTKYLAQLLHENINKAG